MKKILALVLCLVMVLSFAACGGNNADKALGMSDSPLAIPALTVDYEIPEDFKIGFICLHEESSTYDLNFINAVLRFQEATGLSNEQVIIKRNIGETEQCYEAAVELVNQGCDIIFANSFGHEPFMAQAAAEFPEVEFCHATGVTAASAGLDNFHNAFASIYQGRYLAGIAAGLKLNEMIAEGKITADQAKMGYVGAYTYAEVISGYTSFYLGAKSVCPTVTMDVQFTGEWYHVDYEKNAAEALLARNCVLISQHADSMGAPGACEAAGVPNVSYNGSTYEACPETFIVSSAINWAPYYNYITKCVATGAKIDTNWCGGIEEGSVVLTGINLDVAADGTVDAVKAAIEKFKAGTLNVFDTANWTVEGKTLTNADDANISDGYFHESEAISAPSFAYTVDGITLINQKF